MGLFDTTHIQATVYSALSPLYSDATIELWKSERNPDSNTMGKVFDYEAACKVQKDACTQAQRREVGYSATDVRFLILQYGLALEINDDSRLVFKDETYSIQSVSEDPPRSYWDVRARIMLPVGS